MCEAPFTIHQTSLWFFLSWALIILFIMCFVVFFLLKMVSIYRYIICCMYCIVCLFSFISFGWRLWTVYMLFVCVFVQVLVFISFFLFIYFRVEMCAHTQAALRSLDLVRLVFLSASNRSDRNAVCVCVSIANVQRFQVLAGHDLCHSTFSILRRCKIF